MFSRQSAGARCLALLVFAVLPLVACAGSSTNVDVHVVSETATYSRGDFLVRSYGRSAAGPVKQRVAAHHRALYGCVPAILAAAVVALSVLRCASLFTVRTRPDQRGRLLADGGKKDVLGVCGATLGGADARPPSDDREGEKGAALEEGVSKVLEAIDELTALVEKSWPALCPLQALMMVVRFQSIAILELGSLASLLEEPLEQKRKDAAEKAIVLSHSILQTPEGGRYLKNKRFRVRELLAVLIAVKKNSFPPPPLDAASRRAKLADLVLVQEAVLEMARALLSEMASFHGYIEKIPPVGPHRVLGDLFHVRKMRLLQEPDFWARFMWFQKSARRPVLLDPQKGFGGPPPPSTEQIQELQAIIMQAQLPETQEPQSASMSHPGPPDVSVTPQQPGDGSTSSTKPHPGSVQQAALSLQSLSIGQSPGPGPLPPPGFVRPPPGFPPRPSVSWYQRSHSFSHRFLPPSPHPVPAPAALRQPLSATATSFVPRAPPAPGATPGQALPPPAPPPFASFLRPFLRFPSSPQQVLPGAASSGLSPHARPFFPLTSSSAPGAHRTQHLFYGDPYGPPTASGYSADARGASPEASQESHPDSKDQT